MARRWDARWRRAAPSRRGWGAIVALLCLAVVAGLVIAPSGPASSQPSRAEALESTLQQVRARLGVPGVSAAVIQNGQSSWAGTAGTELNGGGDSVTPQTLFVTASTAKTVTAAMVLRLVDEGKLRLDETVGRLLPGLREGSRITVRELLQHTSGLPNYLTTPRIQRLLAADPEHAWTRTQVLHAIGNPQYRPGTRSTYSDSNYIALGGVIEAVEHKPVQDSFEDLIRGPLGLTSSSWRYDNSQIGDFAHPNIQRPNGSVWDPWSAGTIPTAHWGEVWTDGGLASTATELADISHTMVMGPLLKPATRRAMLDFSLNGRVGLGVFQDRFLNRQWVGHAGLWAGFTSEEWTYRQRGLTIAVLTNLQGRPGSANPAEMIFKSLAHVALGS